VTLGRASQYGNIIFVLAKAVIRSEAMEREYDSSMGKNGVTRSVIDTSTMKELSTT